MFRLVLVMVSLVVLFLGGRKGDCSAGAVCAGCVVLASGSVALVMVTVVRWGWVPVVALGW